MNTRFSAIILSTLIAPVATGVVNAAPVGYTSEAAWLAALGTATISTENFESSPVGVLSVGTTDIGLFDVTIGPNNSASINGIVTGGAVNGSNEFRGFYGSAFGTDPVTNQIDFGFDESVSGFAGTWDSTTTGTLLTLTVNGTTLNFSNFLTGAGDGFFGVIDTVPFSSVSFGSELPSGIGLVPSGEQFAVDNVKIAAAAVPEPTTLALMGLGLAGVGFARKKKQA